MDYKDKIRKLLALAESPNEHEAKAALLKARQLMAEHKLSENDVKCKTLEIVEKKIEDFLTKEEKAEKAAEKARTAVLNETKDIEKNQKRKVFSSDKLSDA